MKYIHFLITSIIITMIYLYIVYFYNKKYHLIEKLGNYTGTYNNQTAFRMHPLSAKSDSSTSFKGPFEIPFKSGNKEKYEYNKKLPCTEDRSDYVSPQGDIPGYCSQTRDGGKGEKDIYSVDNLVRDYRVRFLGNWKDNNGELFIIKKDKDDSSNSNNVVIFEILNKKITEKIKKSLYKPNSNYNPDKYIFNGSVKIQATNKLPYIEFTDLKNINICTENSSYSDDICMHSEIRLTLGQKKSDFIILGNDPKGDSSIKLYKTLDKENETNKYTLSKDRDYVNKPNIVNEQTDKNVSMFNLNTECSIPCKDAPDCNAFAYIPASLSLQGKCIFYNVDKKEKEQTFDINKETNLKELAAHLSISESELFQKNKDIFSKYIADETKLTDPIPVSTPAITIIVPKKIISTGTYLYELDAEVPITST